MKSVIKLEDVKKTFHLGQEVEVHALKGINLDVKRGEFVSIVGKSGSGKSTTMNMIGCLDTPTSGKIYLDSKDTSKLSEDELAKIRGKKIGFVFQRFNLIQSLTALENVMVPMIFQKQETVEERRSKAIKLLEMVELGHRIDHIPSELSGGESQRVAIARALANDPELILADEPTGNLDSKTGKRIMGLLKNLNEKEGKTIVMITHDTSLARKAQRLINLKDGVIQE